jgi:hypothetical protein
MAEATIAKSANITTPSRMASFLESASYWTGIAAVAFTAAAAVAGSLSWYFSYKLSDKKDAEFREFQESSKIAVASANEKAAEANARAADANRIAEEERLARVKLETRLAPRILKGASQTTVAKAIVGFAPQKYDILWYPDDPESLNLANDIYGALQMARWVHESSNSWLGFMLVSGVVIEFAPSKADTAGVASKALAEALEKEGIVATAEPTASMDGEKEPETIRIKVGKKP